MGSTRQYARSAGLDDEEIDRIASGAAAEEWSPRQQALLNAADELIAGHELSEPTWTQLSEHFETAQLIEIPFIVGQYAMLSMVANGLGVPVDPEGSPLPG